MRLLLIPTAVLGLALLAPAAGAAPSEDVEALIRRQSQEFSDASASGDAAVLGRYLDERVVFMNEGGEIATRKEIVDNAFPLLAGTKNTLMQTDWGFELHGDVAVTRFTDVSTFAFHGQTLRAKYRSTEIWLKEPSGWKMISSQTMAVQDDPPAVTLPDAMLHDYVGTYRAGPDYVYRITLEDHELKAAANGGTRVALAVEIRDVLFTPGQPRTRRLFQRDASGRVTGFISRREGHDIVLTRVN